MSTLAKNIKYLRNQFALTQTDLAEKLGLQRTMISAYEDARSEPRLSSLKVISEMFSVSIDELIHHDIEEKGRRVSAPKDLKVLAITIDQKENENISMVGQKASAGYLNGFSDPEFVQTLPRFQLPTLARNRTYRAFELSGDSMLPLISGTIVIGAYVERILEVISGKTYVLITDSEGIVYKRVFNYVEENGKLFLVSDNTQYKPYEISAEDVLEVWEAKAFISTDFPSPKDRTKEIGLNEIAEMILDLKDEIKRVKA